MRPGKIIQLSDETGGFSCSPDGEYIALISNSNIRTFHPKSGQYIGRSISSSGQHVQYSKCGKYLYQFNRSQNNQLLIWDVITHLLIKEIYLSRNIKSFTFNPIYEYININQIYLLTSNMDASQFLSSISCKSDGEFNIQLSSDNYNEAFSPSGNSYIPKIHNYQDFMWSRRIRPRIWREGRSYSNQYLLRRQTNINYFFDNSTFMIKTIDPGINQAYFCNFIKFRIIRRFSTRQNIELKGLSSNQMFTIITYQYSQDHAQVDQIKVIVVNLASFETQDLYQKIKHQVPFDQSVFQISSNGEYIVANRNSLMQIIYIKG